MSASEAIVTRVQRFSVHDGPGIRTTVFFKGCSLRCAWCHNPETMARAPELSVDVERCLDCHRCAVECPREAIESRAPEGIDADLCDNCFICADACPSGAIQQVGQRLGVDELLARVLADRAFYDSSGGGVTLSGGEPVLQGNVVCELALRLKEAGVHVLLQTAGHYPFERLEPLLPLVDRVFFDWKLPTAERFAALTGGRLALVEHTLRRTLVAHKHVTVRIPLLPGQNTEDAQVAAIATRLRELGVESVVLLPYNGLWEAKLSRLRTDRGALGWTERVDVDRVRRGLASHGLTSVYSGETQ